MTAFTRLWLRVAVAAAAAAACGLAAAGGQTLSADDQARRQLDLARRLVRQGNTAEGLKLFRALVETYPASDVADDALLEMAQRYLEDRYDLVQARASVDELLSRYPDGSAVPLGLVVSGRIKLAARKARSDIAAALGEFEKVAFQYARSEAVPVAGFYAGEALRDAERFTEALDWYWNVLASAPRSEWAGRARYGAALCLAATGNAAQAMNELQRVRDSFPGLPEASQARELVTILYRLYLRRAPLTPFVLAPTTIPQPPGRLRDVWALSFDSRPESRGRLLAVSRGGVIAFEPSGAEIGTLLSGSVSAVASGTDGRPWFVVRGALEAEGGLSIPLAAPRRGKPGRPLEDVPAAVMLATGVIVVADRQEHVLAAFTREGTHLGPFAQVDAVRLAASQSGVVAALDESKGEVVLLDRDGTLRGRIAASGPGYQIGRVVDLAFDAFGHLYLLDRAKGAVLVFSPGPKPALVAQFSVPERAPGAFRRAVAFTLDAAGRLYIYDEREERILVYQ